MAALALVLALGLGACGGGGIQGTVASGESCGTADGVPGEIVVQETMSCGVAADIARAYFRSGEAPRDWVNAPKAASGWECSGGHIPGEPRGIAECESYSTSGSAQTELAQVFDVLKRR
jgi:hypothetical protein